MQVTSNVHFKAVEVLLAQHLKGYKHARIIDTEPRTYGTLAYSTLDKIATVLTV